MGGRALHPRRTQHANGDQETEDEAVALDNATDRANLMAAYQLVWRDGCEVPGNREASARCRAGLFVAASARAVFSMAASWAAMTYST